MLQYSTTKKIIKYRPKLYLLIKSIQKLKIIKLNEKKLYSNNMSFMKMNENYITIQSFKAMIRYTVVITIKKIKLHYVNASQCCN